MTHHQLSRRSALRTAAGIAVSAAGAATLVGCSDSDGPENTADRNAKVQLPTYVPYTTVKPDLPADESGVMAGFLKFPQDRVTYSTDAPASGGAVTVLSRADGSAPPPLARNRYWQELNKRIGAEFQVNLAPPSDYPSKFATVMAGGDLPDLAMIMPNSVPNLPDLLAARFQDLSEHLAGDAIKKYPALANIPPQTWKNTIFNGGIYAIPIHRGIVGSLMLTRADLFTQLGASHEVSDGDAFIELCRDLTDPAKHRWALGDPLTTLTFALEMMDAPNVWRVENGRFTSQYESEEMKAAMNYVATLWKEQLIHPDGFTGADKVNTWLSGGTIAMSYNSYNAWQGLAREALAADSPATFDAIATPGVNGGQAPKFLSRGYFSITAFKKASKPRIEELLRVADWLAAPFGTAENLFLRYGIEGHNYNWTAGEPVATEGGTDERRVPAAYISTGPAVLYTPNLPEATEKNHAYQAASVPKGKPLPTLGLFSNTDSEKGPGLDRQMSSLQSDVIQGRKSMDEWDAGVKKWRQDGGDQIRAEYEKSLEE